MFLNSSLQLFFLYHFICICIIIHVLSTLTSNSFVVIVSYKAYLKKSAGLVKCRFVQVVRGWVCVAILTLPHTWLAIRGGVSLRFVWLTRVTSLLTMSLLNDSLPSSSPVPKAVIVNTRAVLLSTKKGVLLKNFKKDYFKLVGGS